MDSTAQPEQRLGRQCTCQVTEAAFHEGTLIAAAHGPPGPLLLHFVSFLFTLNIFLGSPLFKPAVIYLVHRKGIKWELIKQELLN